MEYMSGYGKSAVRPACIGLDDLKSMLLPAGSGLVPATSGMVNSIAHEIL